MIPPRAGPAFGPRQAGSNELVQQAPHHGGRGVEEAGAPGHGNASAAADFVVQHPAPVALRRATSVFAGAMFPLPHEPGHRVAAQGLRVAAHAPQQAAVGWW